MAFMSTCNIVIGQAAVRKYHRLGGLNRRNLFLRILQTGKSKTKLPANWVHGESPLPNSQMAAFLMYPHTVQGDYFFPDSS